MVEWFWWDSSLIFDDQLVSFSALTLLVFVPEMTHNVSSGTLNHTHSLTPPTRTRQNWRQDKTVLSCLVASFPVATVQSQINVDLFACHCNCVLCVLSAFYANTLRPNQMY